jgi:hypothetical protein
MIVAQVPDENIPEVFARVKHLLEKALERGVGEFQIEDVFVALLRREQQLWVAVDEETGEMPMALTTQLLHFPHATHLGLLLTGAEPHTIKSWIDEWQKPVEKFCRMYGVSHMITFGRDGWEKFLGGKGFSKYYTVMAKEIKDEESASD